MGVRRGGSRARNNGASLIALQRGTCGGLPNVQVALEQLFGSGGGGTVSADLAALGSLPATVGGLVYVESLLCYFHLNPTSTLTPDGITVIAASGGGNWERIVATTALDWIEQTDWYIDPIAGDDENDGSSGSPIQTHTELVRRWGPSPRFTQKITINIVSDLPEVISVDGSVADGGYLYYRGTPTQVDSGTFTNWTTYLSFLQRRGTMTDASLVLGSEGFRARDPISNQIWWLQADLGGGQYVRSSQGVVDPDSPNSWTGSDGSPPNSDFVIETLPSVQGISVNLRNERKPGEETRTVFFDSLYITGDVEMGAPRNALTTFSQYFFGCRVQGLVVSGGSSRWYFCFFGDRDSLTIVNLEHVDLDFVFCFFSGVSVPIHESNVNVAELTPIFGVGGNAGTWSLKDSIFTISGQMPVFDTSATAFSLTNSTMFNQAWGNVTASYGVVLSASSRWYFGSQGDLSQFVTGGSDCRVAGVDRTWAQLPYIDPTTNALAVQDVA